MNDICFKANIFTDSRYECLSLHSQPFFLDFDVIVRTTPSLSTEGVEGKHCLIQKDDLHVMELDQLELFIHFDEHVPVVR